MPMSILNPQVSPLSRAILRCEVKLASDRLSEGQNKALEGSENAPIQLKLGVFPTSILEDREYIIIPVVACIGDRVAHPTSEANLDELIPAEVLGDVPYQWDGRPIILDHPPLDEDANTPDSYQSRRFGLMFNTSYDTATNKLTTDAWIDYSRAKEVGSDYLIDKIISGEVTEVSIGVLRQLRLEDGVFKGKAYQAVWVKLISDHLAFLHSDQIGACAVDDGCGAGRLGQVIDDEKNQDHKTEDQSMTVSNSNSDSNSESELPLTATNPKGVSIGGLFQRFKSLFSGLSNKSNAESTAQQIKFELYRILFDRVPGLMDVFDILPESSICLFETYRIETGYEQWAIRYQQTGDVVTVAEGEQPIKVMPKTVWVSVETGAALNVDVNGGTEGDKNKPIEQTHQCGCQKNKEKDKAANNETVVEPMIETTETIGDSEVSEKKDESIATPPVTTTPAPAPAVQSSPASTSAPVDLEAYLKTAPPEIRRIVERDRQHELRTRNAAVESILANQRQEVWNKEGLEALDTETLVKIDQSLQGDEDGGNSPVPTQQSYPNYADYSGSRSSYGTTNNRQVDPRDNSRSLGWGGVEKKAAN